MGGRDGAGGKLGGARRAPVIADLRPQAGIAFAVKIALEGEVGESSGWVMDFAEITQAWQPLHDVLDHHYLNEVEGLENPTSENIARWIWERLKPELPGLSKIALHETCEAGCIYEG